MKKFVAVYIGTTESFDGSDWSKLDAATRQAREREGVDAWSRWMNDHQSIVVDMGGPLGRTKRASKQGVSDVRNNITGYVVVQAESHDAAARLFLNHPHFTIFPGDSVEIMECLPMPGTV
jgi:hypothetical protein